MALGAAIPIVLGGAEFLKWLFSRGSTDSAADAQMEALSKGQGAIESGKDKALELFKPYLQNAGQDYNQMRGLVQGGFFQQPYAKGFQSQSYSPQGFSFNPSQGGASFAPFRPQGGPATFQAQSLPGMPQQAPQAAMPGQGGQGLVPQRIPPMLQGGLLGSMSDTLGPTAPPLPNKNQVPNPFMDVVTPPAARLPTQPLTFEERMAIMRMGGSGPFAPYGNPTSGGLLGRTR